MNLRVMTKNNAVDPEIGFLENRFQSRLAAQRLYLGFLKILFSKTKISYPILGYWTLSKNLRALLADYSRNSL